MRKQTSNPWLPFSVLLGTTIMLFVLDNTIPMSSGMHKLFLMIIVVFILISGASLIYLRANSNTSGHAWWDDDDWTDWGGI